jgi:hypothetical protein
MMRWPGNRIGWVVLLAACAVQPDPPRPPRVPTPGVAHLPPQPDLNPPTVPERYPDGAWSVRGLLASKAEARHGKLDVRGVVATLRPCPLEQRVCVPAPYLQLTDAKSGLGQRLLVGGERDLESWNLKVGDEVVLRGEFSQGSRDGTWFAPEGMLLVQSLPMGSDGRRRR